LSSSIATCTTTALVAGTNSFVAIYSGSSTYSSSTSSTLNYIGNSPPSAPGSVSVTASNGNVNVSWTAGGAVTGVTVVGYTATAYSGATTDGTCVTTVWGPTPLTCTIPDLPLSTTLTFGVTASSVTATGSSTSATSPSSLTLSLASSTTTLSALQASAQNIGAPITLIAKVPSAATGTVSFDTVVSGTATAISNCSAQPINLGLASCMTSFATAGTYTLEAVYSGDTTVSGLSNYSGSTSSTVSYTISSTTLTGSTSPLTITTTNSLLAGPYGTAITLLTAGGNGSSPTFSVSNGTATGCSLSGIILSSTSPGTCLVTATQSNFNTYLGQSSNVTSINFWWYYQATLDFYLEVYECVNGGTLSGTTCSLFAGGSDPNFRRGGAHTSITTRHSVTWNSTRIAPNGSGSKRRRVRPTIELLLARKAWVDEKR
jgi:hypothetical protein